MHYSYNTLNCSIITTYHKISISKTNVLAKPEEINLY
nr:MAG TPA: hypothetical protein [Caudoviricetes sp.]